MKLVPEQNKLLSSLLNVNINAGPWVPRLKSPWGLENGNCVISICSAFSLSPLAPVGAKDKTMRCWYNGADAVVLWPWTGDHL